MVVVILGVEARGKMAAGAGSVALSPYFEAVWVVAVRAGDAGPVHLALKEGSVDVDLVQDLAVGVVEPLRE